LARSVRVQAGSRRCSARRSSRAAAGYGLKLAISGLHPLALAFVVTAAFGAVYFAAAHSLRIDEARAFVGALVRRLRRA
jgi:hypothetical protein